MKEAYKQILIQKRIVTMLIATCILVVACILLASQFWENRGRAETHDGMNLVPTFNTKVNLVNLNFINTLNPPHLVIVYSIEHIDNTKNDSLAFVIPYDGNLSQNYPGWHVLPIKDEHATIIYKNFFCSQKSPCSGPPDSLNMDFVFSNDIDSKDSYAYSLAIPFSNSILNGKIQDMIDILEPHEKVGWNQDNLKTTVSFTLKQDASILNAIPPPELNFFFVHSTNQTNNVLQWYVSGDHLIYVNYEIPFEKDWFFILTSISSVLFGTGVTLLVTTVRTHSNRSTLTPSIPDSYERKSIPSHKQGHKNTILVLGLVIMGLVYGGFGVYYQYLIDIHVFRDISNLFVFFVSLGFGSGLSLTFYILAKRDQEQIGKLVRDHEKIRRSRELDALDKLQSRLEKLQKNMKLIKDTNYIGWSAGEIREFQLPIQQIVYDLTDEIKSIMNYSDDTLISEISNPVKTICKFQSLPEDSVFTHYDEVMREIEKTMNAIKPRFEVLKSQN